MHSQLIQVEMTQEDSHISLVSFKSLNSEIYKNKYFCDACHKDRNVSGTKNRKKNNEFPREVSVAQT